MKEIAVLLVVAIGLYYLVYHIIKNHNNPKVGKYEYMREELDLMDQPDYWVEETVVENPTHGSNIYNKYGVLIGIRYTIIIN